MVQRIFSHCSAAILEHVETIHLLLHSPGGSIGDGIGIYNYLRKMPLNIIAYNGGTVSSIAVLIFLGAKQRRASKTATFMIHRSHWNPGIPSSITALEAATSMLKIDDARIDEILEEHIKLPADKRALHKTSDLTITATEALEYGLIHEISDFEVPPGNQLYNLSAP
jgi:ATP-dependent Clp protease protease subunit